MSSIIKRIAAAALAAAMCLSFTSCAEKISATELSGGYERGDVKLADVTPSPAAVDLALRLLSASAGDGGESIVISPYSILSALALTMNGASGETLAEMESALGFTLSELNGFLPSYTASLPSTDKEKLTSANSIWMKDDKNFHVKESFLQRNADLYCADIYSAPFNEGTRLDINNWISDRTDGMIKDMLDEIPPEAVMYLINAVLFDAEWSEPYMKELIRSGEFTNAAGKSETVDLMYDYGYGGFKMDGAVGFVRYYADYGYEFIAVLPDAGTTPEEYLRTLDGKALTDALSGGHIGANTSMPKFSVETKTLLDPVLEGLGMKRAFDADLADFSELGKYMEGNLYISRVLHQAKIDVDERGTKAGAATIVEIGATGGEPEETIEVYLTRPFLFFIADTATHMPIFCGIVNSVGG